jgi:hypothetical protein
MIETEKGRRVHHAKVKRQSQRSGAKPAGESERRECVKGELAQEQCFVDRGAEQKKTSDQSRQHGEWRNQANYFVRQEKEQRQGLKGPQELREISKLL